MFSEQRKQNIILGLCEGYNVGSIRPFVDSLKKVNYSGRVVLFTRNRAKDLIDFFQKHEVEVCSYKRARMGFFTQSVRTVCNMLFALNKSPKALKGQEKLAQFLWNVQASRYLHYRDYLYCHREKFNWVMLTDVRDVVFQSDPFRWPLNPGLHVFEEYPGVRLDRQMENRNWIKAIYGEEGLMRLRGYPIICSGVTIAPIDVMIAYLDEISNELAKKTGPVGFDQGVHNYLVRNNRLVGLNVHEFNKGPVVHVGIAPREAVFTADDGSIVDQDGKLVPVIHQYDRHDDLIEKFVNN